MEGLRASKLSVIMPAYNEEENIAHTLRETVRCLNGVPFELVVVDDGSRDNTAKVARGVAQELPQVKVVRYPNNAGKGYALKYGAGQATGDYVAFVDADLDLNPRQLANLWRVMQETGADLVIGSKRHPQSNLRYPWKRRLMSIVYYGMVRLLFGLPVRDTQTGLKLFKAEVLRRVLPRLVVKRFAFDLELLVVAHMLGYRFAEAPIELDYQRQMGRIRPRDIRNIILDTLGIFFRRHYRRSQP
ncbi:MAG: glycosyltransferase [Chloroflexi bacterium]|nr:glycosyltransferase [Chloroflexota bacterium]